MWQCHIRTIARLSKAAMKTGYTDIVVEMSQKLCQAVLEQEPDLVHKVHELNGEVNKNTAAGRIFGCVASFSRTEQPGNQRG